MVAREEIPIRRPSGRRFVQRGQRLLLSSWPHKNVYCYPQRTIRPRRPRIDAAYDEIFRDWIVSLSRPSRSSPHSYPTSPPSLLPQPIFFLFLFLLFQLSTLFRLFSFPFLFFPFFFISWFIYNCTWNLYEKFLFLFMKVEMKNWIFILYLIFNWIFYSFRFRSRIFFTDKIK